MNQIHLLVKRAGVPYSPPAVIQANGIELVYDSFGHSDAPPLLLIMGLGVQMIGWDAAFCVRLAAQGYRIIRFDNRDVGLSTKFDEADTPGRLAFLMAFLFNKAIQAPYLLSNMAEDAVSLLDALRVDSAHVVGASMGGMIGQLLAIHYPQRMRTLTSFMSTTSDPRLPRPSLKAAKLFLKRIPTDLTGFVESSIASSQLLSGPRFPIDEARIRRQAKRAFKRGFHPAGIKRQLAAVLASGSRKEALQNVTAPTLVIHGDADPLVPLAAGMATAQAVPGARLMVIEGLGHGSPPSVWPQLIEAVTRHAVA